MGGTAGSKKHFRWDDVSTPEKKVIGDKKFIDLTHIDNIFNSRIENNIFKPIFQ